MTYFLSLQTNFMSFTDLGLSPALLEAVQKKGYTQASPIQEKAIPFILKGRDVLASAQTGTGKTAAFALPILQLLSEQKPALRKQVRALILTPTRELAAQIQEEITSYGSLTSLKSAVIFGGVSDKPQIAKLRQGLDILVATPGRLLDLYNQKELSLQHVEILVLDEADRMLDMGFLRDIQRIIKLLPIQRQNLLFSATFSPEIKVLAQQILKNEEYVAATPQNTTAEKVTHKVYFADKGQKPALLIHLIEQGNWEQVLVFTRTKHGANKLCEKLLKQDISSAAIHGNKSQTHRTKTLENFKKGSIRVLVATDIAARGLDIPLLPYVINFELPNIAEDYVHRIGRTARAGASGEAISFVSQDEKAYLRDIEKLLKQSIPSSILEGFEPNEEEEVVVAKAPDKRNSNNKKRSQYFRNR